MMCFYLILICKCMCVEGVVKYFYEDSGSSGGAGIAGKEDSG